MTFQRCPNAVYYFRYFFFFLKLYLKKYNLENQVLYEIEYNLKSSGYGNSMTLFFNGVLGIQAFGL